MSSKSADQIKRAAISGLLFLGVSLPGLYAFTDRYLQPNGPATSLSLKSAVVHSLLFALVIYALLYFGERNKVVIS